MKIILIGKNCVPLNAIKEMVGYENITTTNDVSNVKNKDQETKIIYIKSQFMYSWEYWMAADIHNEYNNNCFLDDIMNFRNLDTNDCDLIIEYDGTCLTSICEKIRLYIEKGGVNSANDYND